MILYILAKVLLNLYRQQYLPVGILLSCLAFPMGITFWPKEFHDLDSTPQVQPIAELGWIRHSRDLLKG